MRAARLRGGGAVAFVQIGEIFYVEIDAEEGEEEVGKGNHMARGEEGGGCTVPGRRQWDGQLNYARP